MTRGDRGLDGVTRGDKELQGVTRGEKGLQGVRKGYKGLQGGDKGLQRGTSGDILYPASNWLFSLDFSYIMYFKISFKPATPFSRVFFPKIVGRTRLLKQGILREWTFSNVLQVVSHTLL